VGQASVGDNATAVQSLTMHGMLANDSGDVVTRPVVITRVLRSFPVCPIGGGVGNEPHVEQFESEVLYAREQAVKSRLIEFGRENGHARPTRHDNVLEGGPEQLAGLTLHSELVVRGHSPFD
jgi:hypothetical protein